MFALSDVLHLKPPSSTTDHLYKRYKLDAYFMNVPMVFHHLNWTTQTLLCLSLSDTQIDILKVSEFPRIGCSSVDIRSNIGLQPCTKCFVSDCSVFDLVPFVFNCQNYSVIDLAFHSKMNIDFLAQQTIHSYDLLNNESVWWHFLSANVLFPRIYHV